MKPHGDTGTCWAWRGSDTSDTFTRAGRRTRILRALRWARRVPDGKHLFVCVGGAGYVIDSKSRTLVERIGTEVVGAIEDDLWMLFIICQNDTSLEAFGRTGHLWKTDTIGTGGLRRLALTRDALVGEARHPILLGWVGFSVKLATGKVAFDFTCRGHGTLKE